MNYTHRGNKSHSIIYETASQQQYTNYPSNALGEGFSEDGFFNLIAFRGFMVLSVCAIAANLRVIIENAL